MKVNVLHIYVLQVLSVLFYLLYCLFAERIHHTGISASLDHLNPWLHIWAKESDGTELQVMTFAFPAFLFLGYLLCGQIHINPIQGKGAALLALLPGVVLVVYNFFSKEKHFHAEHMAIVVLVVGAISYFWIQVSARRINRWMLYVFLFLIFSVVGFYINNTPSLFNYNFLIAPANHFLQGDAPGTFYMQYNLLSTGLFTCMQKINLGIAEMQSILILIVSIFMLLYAKTAEKIFTHTVYVGLFVLVLFLVRMVSIYNGPVCEPQVSPLRMDLWVPLLLIVRQFGFRSTLTSFSFALMYVADDTFGLLYLGLYFLFLLSEQIHHKTHSSDSLIQMFLLMLPGILTLIGHYCIFDALGSAGSKIYVNLQLGFLPIAKNSAFWILVCWLPLMLYFLNKTFSDKPILYFIFGIACVQLVYFFGRSHDHNLLNISGIFIFILFLTLDQLYSVSINKKTVLNFSILLVIGTGIYFNTQIKEKIDLIKTSNGPVFIQGAQMLDKEMALKGAYVKSLGTDKILILSEADGYINYRLGLKQVGYFSPFLASVYPDQTTEFLINQVKLGYRLIVFPMDYDKLSNEIISLTANSEKEKFIESPLEQGLTEILLRKGSDE